MTVIVDGIIVATKIQDLDGNKIVLDADGDTSIHADTDDQIDVEVGGVDVVDIRPTGLQDHGNEPRTATVGGGTTGLITQGTKFVTITAGGDANSQISLPAATIGDIITLITPSVGCELISAVAAHKVNNVVVGATNELALVANSSFRCEFVAANTWVVRGFTNLGADIGALVPNGL